MRKSKWLAAVLALALVVTPVQGVSAAETGAEEVQQTVENSSVSEGNAAAPEVSAEPTATPEEVVPTATPAPTATPVLLLDTASDNNTVTGPTETPSVELAAPTGLTWGSKGRNYINVSWEPVYDASQYLIEYYVEGKEDPVASYKTYGSESRTEFYVRGMESGVYKFRVQALGYNENGEFSEFSDTMEIKKMPTPVAKWGDNNVPVLDPNLFGGESVTYQMTMYLNGEAYTSQVLYGNAANEKYDYSNYNYIRVASMLNGSGSYQFTLKAQAPRGFEYFDSDESQLSDTWEYKKPSQRLDAPVTKPHATLPGVFEISVPRESVGYSVMLYHRETEDQEWLCPMTSLSILGDYYDGSVKYFDFRKMVTEGSKNWGLGQYCISVVAVSSDVNTVGNSTSVYSDTMIIDSLPLDMTPVENPGGSTGSDTDKDNDTKDPEVTTPSTVTPEQVAEIQNSLQDIMSSETNATDAKNSIVEKVDQEELRASMQQDAKVAETIGTIEKDYVKENNITVNTNVRERVNTFMDPEAISVVGAGLNVSSGSVTLEVSVPSRRVDLGSYTNYNNLQFEISLSGDNLSAHAKLAIPVLVTMPIPKGLSANNLEIIHCKADNTYERILPTNNGDGTISFAVTEFSTFVFLNKDNTKNDEVNSGASSDSESSSWSAEPVYNVDWNAVQQKVGTAAAGTTDVVTGNEMKISGQLLQSLKTSGGVLALHTGNGIAVTISGKDIKKADQNLNITFAENPAIPEQAAKTVTAGALYTRSFEMKEKVLYSTKLDIHFNVGKQYAGKYANLYHYDELSGTMKLEGSFRITDSGAAMFLLYHGDEYILTVTDAAPRGAKVNGVTGNYTVVAGDTLSSIAVKNKTSVGQLLAANPGIKNPNLIRVGQKLVIR